MLLRKSGEQNDLGLLTISIILDKLQMGILLFNEHCEVLHVNRSAQTIIDSRKWLTLENHRLSCKVKENTDLQHRISTASDRQLTNSESLMVLNGTQKLDYLLAGFTTLDTTDNRQWVMCVLVDPNTEPALDISLLKKRYSLTDAEIDITSMIAAGLDYNSIAECRNVEVVTIRSYTKSVFRKLGVSSRAGVVYKVHTTMIQLSILKRH